MRAVGAAVGNFPRSVHALPGAQFAGQATIEKIVLSVTFAAAAVAHNFPMQTQRPCELHYW